MPVRMILAVFALSLAPSLALARCMGDSATHASTASCAEGSVYDAAIGKCVLATNS